MSAARQRSSAPAKWRFAVDRGGTFTDVVGADPEGNLHVRKLLSRSPRYRDASVEGIRQVMGLAREEPFPEGEIDVIRLGTTVATNALLERSGGPCGLVVTRGFSDLLEIGEQDRRELFQLCPRKDPPLYRAVVEAEERIDSRGMIVRPLDEGALEEQIERLRQAGVESVAVVLLHSWINPGHELICARLLESRGFSKVHLSHRSANRIKAVRRGHSALFDAYLCTAIDAYLEELLRETGRIPVEFMQSDGTICGPGGFRGSRALLSGPAGGVVATARLARDEGLGGVVGFDMGGTSTDVSRCEGEPERLFEVIHGGVPLHAEMLSLTTVASGGGSLLRFEDGRFTVGPDSAGADPGAACYGLGGPLTVTDANLVVGRLIPSYFPSTFGPRRDEPLHESKSWDGFREESKRIRAETGREYSPEEAAGGFLRVANERMAMAVKEVTVARGHDVRRDTLVCFGGAAGQHACSLASLLGVERIVVPPLSGVMSAWGIGSATPSQKASRSILLPWSAEVQKELGGHFKALEGDLRGGTGEGGGSVTERRREVELRPVGSEGALTVPWQGYAETLRQWRARFEKTFGFPPGESALEVAGLRVEVRQSAALFAPPRAKAGAAGEPEAAGHATLWYPDGRRKAPFYLREALPEGWKRDGPAVVLNRFSTVVVDPGFVVEMRRGTLTLTACAPYAPERGAEEGEDPVLLEVFHSLFQGIASEMGQILRSTAHSVNIKERQDFSCALFDGEGHLVANAPHIPVHLGAMAETVRAVLEDRGEQMVKGDAYLSNNPYRGGSHLPDMTVVMPIWAGGEERPLFYAAARGHHADVGGMRPGSMHPEARSLDEEGVVVDSLLIMREGLFREQEIRGALGAGKWPARNPGERIGDLRAQLAACRRGEFEIESALSRHGLSTVLLYMKYIRSNAAIITRKCLGKYVSENKLFHSYFEDFLDDGTPIAVDVKVERGDDPPHSTRAVLDFSGSGGAHRGDNLNAPPAVTRAAVLYVLRCLAGRDIPLNGGCLLPVEIRIPPGSILDPPWPSAVAGGNVETSQRLVDVLLGAFGAAAASQGTMNNLIFQVEGDTPYYETVAGGAGACAGADGASGVQVHMTNTRITDPEILELRHPGVRVDSFTLRRGSGGEGRWRGGDGVVRSLLFLLPAEVSLLTERRLRAPYGMAGGGAGRTGRNILTRRGEGERELGHRVSFRAEAGDLLTIETPGGGGFGARAGRS